MPLFEPLKLGDLKLSNRIVMAPMTRNRATATGSATDIMSTYYAQRAGAGLIITEAIQPSVGGQGYINTAGLHSEEQIASWRPVVQQVHQSGSSIVAQLMHAGRIGHSSIFPDGRTTVAPSAIAAPGEAITQTGRMPFQTPRALTLDEIAEVIDEHAAAAKNAIAAGFDGVELHGGYGYLVQQFLASNTNHREDRYGGSVVNRVRFAVEAVGRMADQIGAAKVGIRISPGKANNGVSEIDTEELYTTLLRELNGLGLAYIHIAEWGNRSFTCVLREIWTRGIILNPHPTPEDVRVTPETATHALEEGVADAISFASLFLANPDLPERIRADGPYNEPDRSTFYGGDRRGYLDYPQITSSH